jgi:hypothetical protein
MLGEDLMDRLSGLFCDDFPLMIMIVDLRLVMWDMCNYILL